MDPCRYKPYIVNAVVFHAVMLGFFCVGQVMIVDRWTQHVLQNNMTSVSTILGKYVGQYVCECLGDGFIWVIHLYASELFNWYWGDHIIASVASSNLETYRLVPNHRQRKQSTNRVHIWLYFALPCIINLLVFRLKCFRSFIVTNCEPARLFRVCPMN